jgi:hypothetical protein
LTLDLGRGKTIFSPPSSSSSRSSPPPRASFPLLSPPTRPPPFVPVLRTLGLPTSISMPINRSCSPKDRSSIRSLSSPTIWCMFRFRSNGDAGESIVCGLCSLCCPALVVCVCMIGRDGGLGGGWMIRLCDVDDQWMVKYKAWDDDMMMRITLTICLQSRRAS